MKKEEAMKYIDRFPDVPQKVRREAERTLRSYILYDNKGNGRCTNCGGSVKLKLPPRKPITEETPSGCMSYIPTLHKTERACPKCKEGSTLINCTSNYKGCYVECASNVVILLSKRREENLYIRCYTLEMYFIHNELVPRIVWNEKQRYIYTPSGEARFGREDYFYYTQKRQWRALTKLTEPYFGGNWCNIYFINPNEVKKTFLKHCEFDEWLTDFSRFHKAAKYLKFFRRHPGAERLIKCGFIDVVESCMRARDDCKMIDWKQTEPHKMLKLDKSEFNYLRNRKMEKNYFNYITARECFPEVPLEMRYSYYELTRYADIETLSKLTKRTPAEIAKYISKHNAHAVDYRDYIRNCGKLDYDTTDRAIAFPPRFYDAHDRVAATLEALKLKISTERNEMLKKQRELLCTEFGEYIIIQPKDAEDIIREGRIQCHCVAGYAGRHCNGDLTIMFLRKKSDPETPFYTMEISNNLNIVQCRGYRNDLVTPKPKEIEDIERKYKEYLKKVLPKWEKARKKQTKADKTHERIGA